MVLRNAHLLLLLVLLCNLHQLLAQKKRPDEEFLECYTKDKTKLENCLIKFWDRILIAMRTGDPSLNIIKEPIIIKEILWVESGPSMNFRSILSNITIWGLSNSKVTTFVLDQKSRKVAFNVSTPYINVTTNFAANGTVILLPLVGKGKVNINSTNVLTHAKGDIVPHGSGIKLQNLKSDIDMKDISYKFTETDSTDPIWEALGRIISENINLLFEDMQPFISSKFSTVFEEITAKALEKIPISIFSI